MLRRISFQVASDRRKSAPAEIIETIRRLRLQRLLQRLLVDFPLPERPGKVEAAQG